MQPEEEPSKLPRQKWPRARRRQRPAVRATARRRVPARSTELVCFGREALETGAGSGWLHCQGRTHGLSSELSSASRISGESWKSSSQSLPRIGLPAGKRSIARVEQGGGFGSGEFRMHFFPEVCVVKRIAGEQWRSGVGVPQYDLRPARSFKVRGLVVRRKVVCGLAVDRNQLLNACVGDTGTFKR